MHEVYVCRRRTSNTPSPLKRKRLSVDWLAQAFKKERAAVSKESAYCDPTKSGGNEKCILTNDNYQLVIKNEAQKPTQQ